MSSEKSLIEEFLNLLDKEEETVSGRILRPVVISCSNKEDKDKINEILEKWRTLKD